MTRNPLRDTVDYVTQDGPWALEREAVFVRRCRLARERQGMSQRELSRRLGEAGLPMHPSSVAKLERDDEERRPLRFAEAVALSIILRVPLWEVFLDLDDARLQRAAELTEELDEVDAEMAELDGRRQLLFHEQTLLAERDSLLVSPAGRPWVRELREDAEGSEEGRDDDDGEHQTTA